MLAGGAGDAPGFLADLYLRGESLATIIDTTVRGAMASIGEIWRREPWGIFLEHRATDLCVQALHRLRALVPAPPPGALRMLGGAAPGDPYVLPSLAVSVALADAGVHATNLGADVPLATLADAAEREAVSLVWLSASVSADSTRLVRDLNAMVERLARRGIITVVGGRLGSSLAMAPSPSLHRATTLGELVAFVRGLTRARRPVRRQAPCR